MKPINPRSIPLLSPEEVGYWRSQSGAERLAAGIELNRNYRAFIAAEFRREHPDLTDAEIRSAVAARMLAESDD
jgi:hypothetical protein